MPSASRSVVIGTRATCETKARFAALAGSQGLSEAAFLALVIDKVLAQNGSIDSLSRENGTAVARSVDRITLRLRPGDRALADARASGRRMKTASYLSMLIRTHVRGGPAMPPAELDVLKAVAGHLGAIHRQLRLVGAGSAAAVPRSVPEALLKEVGRLVEDVRESVAGVVRANLISWEAGNA
jgi:hypothetical protein